MLKHRLCAVLGKLLVTQPSHLEQAIIHKAAISKTEQAQFFLVLGPLPQP